MIIKAKEIKSVIEIKDENKVKTTNRIFQNIISLKKQIKQMKE